ncbi:hypothetical protein TNCV_4699311 [Trichonephila clavipes]|nr:hypothetical protein TNCV_4699311 [Trichonephila clavipes]
MNDLSSGQYMLREISIRSGDGIILKIFPCGQDVKQSRVSCDHLTRLSPETSTSNSCGIGAFLHGRKFRENMGANHICRCSTSRGSSLGDLYRQAWELLSS